MAIRRLGLWATALITLAPPALAQAPSSLAVKNAAGATVYIACQNDAGGACHYRDVSEGLTTGGVPTAILTDAAGNLYANIVSIPPLTFASPQHVIVDSGGGGGASGGATAAGQAAAQTTLAGIAASSATTAATLGGTLQVSGAVSISNTPTVNLGNLGGAATATNQATGNTLLASLLGGVATSANQATANTSLATIASSTATNATAANQLGAANFAPVQVSATTTATLVVAARAGRRSVTVENTTTTAVYFGGSGVTAATGFVLPGVVGASLTLNYAGALYATTASGTAALSAYELY